MTHFNIFLFKDQSYFIIWKQLSPVHFFIFRQALNPRNKDCQVRSEPSFTSDTQVYVLYVDYWLSFLHCFWMSCLVYTESSTHIQLKIEMNLLSLLLHIVDTSCLWKNYSKRLNYWRESGEKERKEGRKRKENGRGNNVTVNKLIDLIDSTSNWYNKT